MIKTWIAYHHFRQEDLRNGNKGPLLVKDKYWTPIAFRNRLTHNQQVDKDEVKEGKNKGKLYVTPNKPWTEVLEEARLTGYKGEVREDGRRFPEELQDDQMKRPITASPQELLHGYVVLKQQPDKVCA